MSLLDLFKKKKKPVEEEPKIINGKSIEYKGWEIIPMLEMLPSENGFRYVRCVIKNKELNKGFMIRRNTSKHEETVYRTYSSIFSSSTRETFHSVRYDEHSALEDLVTEAKVIVDVFAEMEEYYKSQTDKNMRRFYENNKLLFVPFEESTKKTRKRN